MYLVLWGLSLGVMSIFTPAAAISAPSVLSAEALVIAFGELPFMHAFGVDMLAAGYGLATNRPQAPMMSEICALAVALVFTGLPILAAHILPTSSGPARIFFLLAGTAWYVNRPQTKRYIAISTHDL